ncbi:MAG TPA: SUMF1/EgtB/PvdO family nonheme iron enzyme [Spirochaetota bacterium]|nr:SUMF1/EgtB/PvdO family nonheme iron enzyme [Spirochaetota bacterium]HOD15783.1 SUMF1/EgtB/PvdO family nonheme iron enzyme [Spirochaetota bacterium]HPG51221.1 SUMF1/EgtB/PvdO family nonheme iron enzyme [Spirochaetota bacterium]HPN14473.1 SUMF1/EgtB/PvdO family nonheme iron enzyme [Spirochaetota bacterium]HQL84149.1 SUMF1/EgtB/PvdO family nonheme iron enzyme [Spirochaetota bacterium]
MIDNEQSYVIIPEGSYTIGLEREAVDRNWDGAGSHAVKKEFLYASCPAHNEEIRRVMISKRLVSRAEFNRFAASTGYLTEAEIGGWGWISVDGQWRKRDGVCWRRPFAGPGDELYASDGRVPVMQVSWNDAASYCRWLSSSRGLLARLPREAEWEAFARIAGVPEFGRSALSAPGITDQEEFLNAVIGASAGEISPPGLLWEWTEDWYDRYPGGGDHRDFGTVYKVLRGGSVLSEPVQRNREFRLRKCPTARSPYYGFRVAVAG